MRALLTCVLVGAVIVLLAGLSQRLHSLNWMQKEQAYQPDALKHMAHVAAVLHNLNPELFIAQMRQESRFNQYARSKTGAIGVAQIMPATAKGWRTDPNDPMQALDAAATAMSVYIQTYKAQGHDEHTAFKLALAAYNAGPGAVAKYKGVPPFPETQHYVKVILGTHRKEAPQHLSSSAHTDPHQPATMTRPYIAKFPR